MSSGSGVCECWRLTPEGVHGSRACPFYGMHWSEVAAVADRTIRCPKCGGMNGEHGLVHTRHGNGGGSNGPCPNRTIGASGCDDDACDYPEPHRHGFACAPWCACGRGMRAVRTDGS